jgi:hypothetical protein
MSFTSLAQYAAFLAIVVLLAKPVGLYLLFVFEQKTALSTPERWL